MHNKKSIGRKGELTWETLIPWIIAIGVLVLLTIVSLLLKDKLIALVESIKTIFRGR